MKSDLALQIHGQGVYKLVLFQGASFGKGLVAHRAGVHHLVHLQIAIIRHGLVAHRAGAGFITVHKQVLIQNAL